MLEEKTIKLLKKAGWNENRKIDISEQVRYIEESGYKMFDKAYAFLEEYGELRCILNFEFEGKIREDIHSTCYEDMKSSYKFHESYSDEVGEETIPVCELYEGEYIVHISESGKFFISEGMYASDNDNFWNGVLGEYQGGFLDWIDYKTGKEYKNSGYKNKNYIV